MNTARLRHLPQVRTLRQNILSREEPRLDKETNWEKLRNTRTANRHRRFFEFLAFCAFFGGVALPFVVGAPVPCPDIVLSSICCPRLLVALPVSCTPLPLLLLLLPSTPLIAAVLVSTSAFCSVGVGLGLLV